MVTSDKLIEIAVMNAKQEALWQATRELRSVIRKLEGEIIKLGFDDHKVEPKVTTK